MFKRNARATIPLCWECNRKLALGGWQYAVVIGEDGHPHEVHYKCIKGRPLFEPMGLSKQ